MSELRDYQRMFVDNLIEDIGEDFARFDNDVFSEDGTLDVNVEAVIRLSLASRIEAYDRERKEQLERDLPTVIARAMADVC